MYKMKIKIWDINEGPSKFSIDEIFAEDENVIKSLYNIIGQEIQVLEKEKVNMPNSYENYKIKDNNIGNNLNEKSIEKSIEKNNKFEHINNINNNSNVNNNNNEIYFTDNGIEFKIINNKIYKKDWIILDKEYQIFNENGKRINKKYIVKIKDWILVKE